MESILNSILMVVIIPILGVLTTYLVAYIKKKTVQLEQCIGNEKAKKYLDLAEDAVCTAVMEIQQTFVDVIKKTGKFERKDQEEAFNLAKNKALAIIGETGQVALKEARIDVDTWLNSKIEYFVGVRKSR